MSCQKGPICHAQAWRVGPFWQDTIDIFVRIASLALGQQYYCSSGSNVILMDMAKIKPYRTTSKPKQSACSSRCILKGSPGYKESTQQNNCIQRVCMGQRHKLPSNQHTWHTLGEWKHDHYSDIIMPVRHLKSPASHLFTQLFIQAHIKENIKALPHLPLWEEFTGDQWIPHTKGQ